MVWGCWGTIASIIPMALSLVSFPLFYYFYPDESLSVAQVMFVVDLLNGMMHSIEDVRRKYEEIKRCWKSSERIAKFLSIEKFKALEDSSELQKGEIEISGDADFGWDDKRMEALMKDTEHEDRYKN